MVHVLAPLSLITPHGIPPQPAPTFPLKAALSLFFWYGRQCTVTRPFIRLKLNAFVNYILDYGYMPCDMWPPAHDGLIRHAPVVSLCESHFKECLAPVLRNVTLHSDSTFPSRVLRNRNQIYDLTTVSSWFSTSFLVISEVLPRNKLDLGTWMYCRSVAQWTTVYPWCRGIVSYLHRIFWSKRSMEGKRCGYNPACPNTYDQNSRNTSRRHSLVGSILGFCVISHCAFSVNALACGFEYVLINILTKFCPPLLHWAKIYSTVYRGPLHHGAPKSQKPKAALNGRVGSAAPDTCTCSEMSS